MGLLSNEKRKNDAPRRFQWWLLVIGFIIGVLFAQVAFPSYVRTVTVFSDGSADGIELTATAIIVGATGTAQATPMPGGSEATPAAVDPLALTAIRLVEEATQQAATPSP